VIGWNVRCQLETNRGPDESRQGSDPGGRSPTTSKPGGDPPFRSSAQMYSRCRAWGKENFQRLEPVNQGMKASPAIHLLTPTSHQCRSPFSWPRGDRRTLPLTKQWC
jgi:hypothetical protein